MCFNHSTEWQIVVLISGSPKKLGPSMVNHTFGRRDIIDFLISKLSQFVCEVFVINQIKNNKECCFYSVYIVFDYCSLPRNSLWHHRRFAVPDNCFSGQLSGNVLLSISHKRPPEPVRSASLFVTSLVWVVRLSQGSELSAWWWLHGK